jgi:hypothetical protein
MVLPFGLSNAPVTFQAYINKALSDLLDTCCIIYLDNILIYSNLEEEYQCHVGIVIERLQQFQLYANLSKCAFSMDMVDFLGFIITLDGMKMENNCVKTIMEWPEPMCPRDILSFLGFANFYRCFIEGYSQIATLLTDLTKGVGLGAKGQRVRKQAYKRPFLIIAMAHEAF